MLHITVHITRDSFNVQLHIIDENKLRDSIFVLVVFKKASDFQFWAIKDIIVLEISKVDVSNTIGAIQIRKI